MVIDGDDHCNEPRDLFDRYLEKEFRERGPKVVEASGTRWMIEGKFLSRPVGTSGHGTSSGYFGTNMAKKGIATTQSLDDVPVRLKDLDMEGIHVQVCLPEHHGHGVASARRRTRGVGFVSERRIISSGRQISEAT